DFGVRSGFQQEAGRGVSKVVHSDTRKARIMQRSRKRAIDRSWADRLTVPVCEDEGGLLPPLPVHPVPALTLTLLLKRALLQPREIDRPSTLFGLRWSKHEAASRLPLQRVPHSQPACVEIDV